MSKERINCGWAILFGEYPFLTQHFALPTQCQENYDIKYRIYLESMLMQFYGNYKCNIALVVLWFLLESSIDVKKFSPILEPSTTLNSPSTTVTQDEVQASPSTPRLSPQLT